MRQFAEPEASLPGGFHSDTPQVLLTCSNNTKIARETKLTIDADMAEVFRVIGSALYGRNT